jgi:hypothetical protein
MDRILLGEWCARGIAFAGEVLLGWARGVSGCTGEGRSERPRPGPTPGIRSRSICNLPLRIRFAAYSLETDDSDTDLRGGYSDYDLRGAHLLPLENVLSLDVGDEAVQDSLGFAETQWRFFSKKESPTTQQRDRRSI